MPETFLPLWISLKTAAIATLLATCSGIAAARWMVAYQGRIRGWLDGALTLPLVLPPTVVGFLLLLLLGKGSATGQLLDRLGLSIIFTGWATVLAATIVAFPLAYKTVLSAFEQVDHDLIDAARTLGASEWRVFWQVLLPLSESGILAGSILAFARALGEFGATLMVGGSIPGVTQTIPIAIYFASESGQMDIAIAWVLIMIAISLVVIATLNYGLNYGNQSGRNSDRTPLSNRNPLSDFVMKGFNWLYFKQFHLTLFKNAGTTSAARCEPNRSHTEQSQPPATSALSLFLQIQKKLSQFELQLQLQATQHPLGLLGASGSGKSMTLRCIAGLETPDAGKIVLNGRVLFDADAGVNVRSCDRNVGIFFQNYALFPHLSVAQNIAFGMRFVPTRQRVKQIERYLVQFGLEEMGDRYPHQLSGGQQQRVALARVLASQPDILLLDEPLSALDTYLRSNIEKLLTKTLADYRGVTLFVTHKLEEAYRVCSHLSILSEGQIIAAGTKEEVFERPPTVLAARVTECKNFSLAHKIGPRHVAATEWDCSLKAQGIVPSDVSHIGIRAHHIRFLESIKQTEGEPGKLENTFSSWLAMMSETQHRVTLFIKLHSEPTSAQDYHLQAEVYREKWKQLKQQPCPWHVQLVPESVIIMRA